jgi:hypothetical protein
LGIISPAAGVVTTHRTSAKNSVRELIDYTTYETGEWSKDFTGYNITLNGGGGQGAAKCSDHNTLNQYHPTYTKGSSDNIEKQDWEKKKFRTFLENITLDFEEGKGTRDTIGMQTNIRRKFGHR